MAVKLINIPFTKTDGANNLRDALNLTQEEIDALGEAGLEAMKQQRFDNWVATITSLVAEEQVDG
jgi:hypothetical protein